jgi:pilus assembly protein Flp/PilA
MRSLLARLWKEEDGQDLTEYALLLVLVSLGAISSISSLATDLSLAFSKAGSNLTAGT